mmetsp:Transcript_54115/g.79328  ORF Transcript_54115/g.79328 Transcript_54115/m.79328 type:complete len:107 (+) Transcript_54115:226-546(+)
MWPSRLTAETISTRPLLVSCVCFAIMRTSKLGYCATDAWQAQVHIVMYRIAYVCLVVLMPCSDDTLFARPLVCLRRCLMPWALGAQLPVQIIARPGGVAAASQCLH